MTAPVTPPPPGEPPLDVLPPDAPATVEDVRASRRWTWVALAWAVAASAIAVIALIQDDKSNDTTTTTSTQQTQTAENLQQSLQQFQKQTNDRLDAFSRRLNDTASQSDVDKVDKRLTQVEDDLSQTKSDVSQTKSDVSKQSAPIQQLQSDVKDLQQRVDDLENQQQSSGTTTP